MSILRNRIANAKPDESPKPPPAVEWLMPQTAGWGLLEIAETVYRVEEVTYLESDETPRTLIRLKKCDGTEYQLTPDQVHGLLCDCPWGTYKPIGEGNKPCRHVIGVKAAYEKLDREQQLDQFLDPPPLHLLDQVDDELAALEQAADADAVAGKIGPDDDAPKAA